MKNKNIRIIQLVGFIILLVATSCNRKSEGSRKAALEIKLTTTAIYETDPVPQVDNVDAADDPAIWLNPADSSKSTIIGTDKKGGLAVYNLKGKQLFYYPHGMMNNVDIRQGVALGNDTLDLVAASNRTTQTISLYKVNQDGSLTILSANKIKSEMADEVYGFCLYMSPLSKKTYAFINSKLGEVEQWEIIAENNIIDAKIVRKFKLETQVEGMVCDDDNKKLFVGEEIDGIWVFDAEPDAKTAGLKIAKSSESDNTLIRFDIEGLGIYYLPNNKGYLIASSQGNYSYAVYERNSPYKYQGSFRITDGIVDGAEETDGLELFSFSLNEDFAHGLLVVQDGFNKEGGKPASQNFKLVAWENVAKLFEPELQMN